MRVSNYKDLGYYIQLVAKFMACVGYTFSYLFRTTERVEAKQCFTFVVKWPLVSTLSNYS